jgi:hypothetical protein
VKNHDRQCQKLLGEMIKQAKKTLIALHKKSNERQLTTPERVQFKNDQNFLSNSNGYIGWLLGCIPGLGLDSALEELKAFATEGYKTEILYNLEAGS